MRVLFFQNMLHNNVGDTAVTFAQVQMSSHLVNKL